MIDKLRIGPRLFVALGLMSLLVAAVAFSGHLGLEHMKSGTEEFLLGDAHLADLALEARTSTLQLRRYEKDYFLNMGAPEVQADYLAKWTAAHKDVVARLDELDRRVWSAADHETLRGMREDLHAYDDGFEQVRAAMARGELVTPQAANIAITKYKDRIHRLENTAGQLGGASVFRMNERVNILQADARRTQFQMVVASLLAIAIALLLSVRLARSITGRERADSNEPRGPGPRFCTQCGANLT
jgi:methyl-accepting chemotaxis protein